MNLISVTISYLQFDVDKTAVPQTYREAYITDMSPGKFLEKFREHAKSEVESNWSIMDSSFRVSIHSTIDIEQFMGGNGIGEPRVRKFMSRMSEPDLIA